MNDEPVRYEKGVSLLLRHLFPFIGPYPFYRFALYAAAVLCCCRRLSGREAMPSGLASARFGSGFRCSVVSSYVTPPLGTLTIPLA